MNKNVIRVAAAVPGIPMLINGIGAAMPVSVLNFSITSSPERRLVFP